MAPKPVEAVFFFRWDRQTKQATYQRIHPGSRYTKNYLQVSGEPGDVLDALFGREGDEEVALTWRWPEDDGGQPGKLRLHKGESENAKRVQVVWNEGGKAPLTWKLGDPAVDPRITIEGDPNGATEAEADAALAEVDAADVRPWFIAVKLKDDGNQLHARTYLENPPPDLRHADVALLPSDLLASIKELKGQSGVFLPIGSPPPAPRAPKIVAAIRAALETDPNVLLVGPPGTGKTVALEDMRRIVEHADTPLTFDADRLHDAFGEATNAGKVVSLAFHPSYAYENFVAGLIPSSDEGELGLAAQSGPLINLANWAIGSDRRALLILDEFNRGPTAAIFGDTLALLDGSKRYRRDDPGAHIDRPFPDWPLQVPPEYADAFGSSNVPGELRLPANLQIVAALNSSDRSVAPLDAALRRRFAIVRVEPDLQVLADHYGVSLPDVAFDLADDPGTWSPDVVKQLALRLLAVLNERIAFVLGDDFLLGHALLWALGEIEGDDVRAALCAGFDARIAQSLRLTFADQDELLAAVLGAGDSGASEPDAGDLSLASWREPPAELEAIAQPHLVVRSVREMSWPDAGRSLVTVLG